MSRHAFRGGGVLYDPGMSRLLRRWSRVPPPPVFARRQRWRRRLIWVAGLVVFVALVVADHRGGFGYRGTDLQRYEGQSFRVVAVIDGDTLDVEAHDGDHASTRVRVWGIDCPELARDRRAAEPWADHAAERARDLAYGESVRLRLQAHRVRDRFGRLLAFVELPGGRDLAGTLLREGLAVADDRWPHDRLSAYAQLEAEARHAGRRLWAVPPP